MRAPAWLVLIAVIAALCGCATAGRDFPRPVAADLVLGETTRQALIARFGPPQEDRTQSTTLKPASFYGSGASPESGLSTRLHYSFVNPMGEAADGISPQRAAYFFLWNDKLVGFEYMSSFGADSTDFPESGVTQIRKMRSTEHEVIDLLGPPSGRAIYPRTRYPEDHSFIYAYFEWNKSLRSSRMKRLRIDITPEGIVRDFSYDNNTKPLPPPPAAPAVVPVYIPSQTRKK